MKPYYEAKGITIYHGDCMEILPSLEILVDLILTDPQYGISQPGSFNDSTNVNKGIRSFDFFPNDSKKQADELVINSFNLVLPLCAKTASAYWWVGHYAFGHLVDLYEAAGWRTRFLVWSKLCPAPMFPGSGWPSAAELCVYAYRPKRTWNYDGTNCPRSNVFVADSYRHGNPGKVNHPTQKPFGVIEPLIKGSSPINGIILDPFMGSGTTLVCAKRLSRKAVGIEIEEKYCEIAAKRLERTPTPLFPPDLPRKARKSQRRLL